MCQALELLSELGGQAGLWLGVSVVALFEVAELIMDVVIIMGRSTFSGQQDRSRRREEDQAYHSGDKQAKRRPHLAGVQHSVRSDTRTLDTTVDW